MRKDINHLHMHAMQNSNTLLFYISNVQKTLKATAYVDSVDRFIYVLLLMWPGRHEPTEVHQTPEHAPIISSCV